MSETSFCVVVPAAGSGRRMAASLPKQYLPLAGRTVIEHALDTLLGHPGLRRLVVALPVDDRRFGCLPVAADPRVERVTGGATRAESVLAGLNALAAEPPGSLVLVHDAARPCVSRAEIDRLLHAAGSADGALLALPVHDTIKRATGADRVAATIEREHLWCALTPQAFRLQALHDALAAAGDAVTDESSAMERAGCLPRLVEGDPANFKITRPGDLALAEAVLASRGGAGA